MQLKLNPLKIILIWIIIMVIVGAIVILPRMFSKADGNQVPLTSLAYYILVANVGVFLLSIITAFVYLDWFKRYWYVNAIFILLTLPTIGNVLFGISKYRYAQKKRTEYVSADTIVIKEEYYNITDKRIRSRSIWRNGLRDSIWTIYNEDGSLLRQEKYHAGSIVKGDGN